MKIYITGLASGYEVEHLVRLFYPMAPLTLTPPEAGEDCVWAERKPDGLLALVREHGGQETVSAPLPGPDGETEAFALASLTYDLLRRWTGIRPPWGKMTGVRPVRLIHDKRAAGWSEAEIDRFFLSRFDCSEQKYQMARAIADLQEPILRLGSEPKTYSLYIGIPFCPSRCSYCSFVSCNLDRDRKLVQPYVDCLCREVEEIRAQAEQAGLKLCSIYIGGGTPTSLSADQLRQLMGTVRQCFDLSRVVEYTVEAGRPDCTDAEKLAVIKEYGATRISINPQTFSDEVLAGIGRRHSAQDILDCFADARKAGHDDINMDLIAGLPGDTVEGFERSLRQAIALDPENITVHTLTLKRASRIVIEDQRENDYADVAAMLERCHVCKGKEHKIYDELIGESKETKDADRFAEVERIEAMSPEEKFAFFQSQLSKCIRCNACRNVCPACSCRKCVFDSNKFDSAQKANVDSFEEKMFHIIRAFHVAGRCTDCGECSRVCPQGIPLHLFNRKFIKDIDTFYGEYQAGEDSTSKGPLTNFTFEDVEPSIVAERG